MCDYQDYYLEVVDTVWARWIRLSVGQAQNCVLIVVVSFGSYEYQLSLGLSQ